jgi:hypothetical protein
MGGEESGRIYIFYFFTKYKGYEKSPEEAKEAYNE